MQSSGANVPRECGGTATVSRALRSMSEAK